MRAFTPSLLAATMAAGIGGWFSAHSSEAAPPPLRSDAPVTSSAGVPPWRFAAVPKSAARFVTREVKLTDEQREMLTKSPAAIARYEVDATRDFRRQLCEKRLHHPTAELCERVLQENGRAIEQTTDVMQRFLRGEIDQDTFQSDYHKAFIDRSIALEQFLSATDFAALEGIVPGVDPFVALTEGFANMPAGFKLGDDILAQGTRPPVDESGSP